MAFESRYSTWKDYYLLIQGVFYGSQGIAYGCALFIAAYLRSFGINESAALGFQALILIPWYIKFLFGLLSDNFSVGRYGRRKPYVFLAAIIGLVGWITLPLYDTYTILILISATAASFGIALADASIDALAVDITPPNRRGSMQGISWGFRAIGFGSATLFAGPLVDSNNWLLLFAIPGAFTTISSLLVLLFKEHPLPDDFSKLPKSVYKEVFGHPAIRWVMLFQILSGAGIAIVFLMETFLSEELGYSAADIGTILFGFGVGMFGGAIILGTLGDRISFSKSLTSLTLIYIIVVSLVIIVDLQSFNQVLWYFILLGIINGGYEATQMRFGMDYSPPVMSGTMFNFYNSLSNIGQIAIGTNLIYALVVIFPTKIGWQFISLLLFLALLIALHVNNKFEYEKIAELGQKVLVEK